MIFQIFGIKNDPDTRKAERFFKERNQQIQFIDLKQKGLSPGEFNSVKNAVGLDNMIDREGKEFQKQNLQHMVFDIEETLMQNPLLYRTPIVRCGKKALVGYHPDQWKQWIDNCQ